MPVLNAGVVLVKGLLKMCMLKIISGERVSGYQIIKRVEVMIGEKPSTGSVYPLLKSMQDKGWIVGEKSGNKTFYTITDKGKEIVRKHDVLKEQIFQKVRESVLLANNTFEDIASVFSEDSHLTFEKNIELLGPLISEISRLLVAGVAPEKIKEVISDVVAELKKLE